MEGRECRDDKGKINRQVGIRSGGLWVVRGKEEKKAIVVKEIDTRVDQ